MLLPNYLCSPDHVSLITPYYLTSGISHSRWLIEAEHIELSDYSR